MLTQHTPRPIHPQPPAQIGAVCNGLPDEEDYELVVWLDYDLERYPRDERTGRHILGFPQASTYARYCIAAGRMDGAWWLNTHQVFAEDDLAGEDITGPDLINLRGQGAGPDPLTLLAQLMHVTPSGDGQRFAEGLSQEELAALRDATPERREDVLALLRSHDIDRNHVGRLILAAEDEAEAAWLRAGLDRLIELKERAGVSRWSSASWAIKEGKITRQEYGACWDDESGAIAA